MNKEEEAVARTLESLSFSYESQLSHFDDPSKTFGERMDFAENIIAIHSKLEEFLSKAKKCTVTQRISKKIHNIHASFQKDLDSLKKSNDNRSPMLEPENNEPKEENTGIPQSFIEQQLRGEIEDKDCSEELLEEEKERLGELHCSAKAIQSLNQEIAKELVVSQPKIDQIEENTDLLEANMSKMDVQLRGAAENRYQKRALAVQMGISATFGTIGGIAGLMLGPVGAGLGATLGLGAGAKVGQILKRVGSRSRPEE